MWVTGLSGAGKTTLCRALYHLLKPQLPELILLDGDHIREAYGNDLGYSEAERMTQIKRVQRLARLLAEQGLVVLVAALYAHPELLTWNRQHLRGYVEIYLKASRALVQRRDSKGLYAADGTVRHVVGLDIPWHEPTAPDLVVDADHAPAPEVLARDVVEAVPRLAQLLKPVCP
ncbi:MAG: adenylyl-sulfate kinase [Candidatus Omnitrophica bacterium]|nr:adenylyl-sulfate kinase [Candidatus Omnitrophota bacterium]